MIPTFTVPASDQSVYYLAQIFGVVGTVLPQPPEGAPQVLGVMFKTFNTGILSIAVLIVLYITIVGVMKTAQEGEFLGRNWNSLWVPIRLVLGIAALIPSPNGYCAIQILVMWVVLQGVGAADVLWNTVLSYSDVAGSPVAAVSVPSVGSQNTFQNLFQALTCQQTAWSGSSYQEADGYGYYCYDPSSKKRKTDSFCAVPLQDLTNITSGPQSQKNSQTTTQLVNGVPTPMTTYTITYNIGPSGACGALTFCDAQSTCQNKVANVPATNILCDACTAQNNTLQQSVTLMNDIASVFFNGDLQFRQWLSSRIPPDQWIRDWCAAQTPPLSEEQCCISQSGYLKINPKCAVSPNKFDQGKTDLSQDVVTSLVWPYLLKPKLTGETNFPSVVAANYVTAIQAAVTNTLGNNAGNISNTILKQAGQQGWIFAGAYYYYLAQMNGKMAESTLPTFDFKAGNWTSSPPDSRVNYSAAGYLTNIVSSGSVNDPISNSVPPQLGSLTRLSGEMNSAASGIMKDFQGYVSGAAQGTLATNPLASLQQMGKNILIVVQVLFAVMVAVIVPLALVGNLNIFALGNGFDNPLGPTISTLVILFAPIVMVVMGALFTAGALLAVYVPLIPYIVYTMGAVAWFILVIEAMVAAPIVALGVLSPNAQHEILGKSEHALMYLFGIFLRPSLMVFGMMAAMLLAIVVVTMINAGFNGVVGSIYQNPGFVELLLFICAYVTLVLAALNKCFALIHIIPDRVLRWIGHAGGEEGAAAAGEALGQVKGGVSGGAGAAAGAAGATRGGAQSASGQKKQWLKAKKAQGGGGAPQVQGQQQGGQQGGGQQGGGNQPPPPQQ